MDDNINHPPHYTKYPAGLDAECIEYTRHMPFSQGNAFEDCLVWEYADKENTK